MRNLTFGDLELALKDLIENRKEHLDATEMGKAYWALLEKKLKAIQTLPPSLRDGRPLSDQLSETDGEHDGWGGALWHMTEAILRAPSASPELKAKALRIRATFISRLGALRDAYADEAAAAEKNRPKAKELEVELQSIPTPTGETAGAWVLSFLNAGTKLGSLLSGRAFIEAAALEGGAIASLRMTTIGIVSRFRTAVADEMAERHDLPRNLDALIFGYFDELSDRRMKASKAEVVQETPPAGGTPPEEPGTSGSQPSSTEK
jgi:hypothetical protein